MPCKVSIVADSLGPNGARVTTMQLRLPRFVLAQLNTHRAISKNARSSRAVPVARLIDEALTEPAEPLHWGANERGMQATRELEGPDLHVAREAWRCARDSAVTAARAMAVSGAHKQIANRLLEPFLWVDVVATATDWSNFFSLRCDRHAQPEMQALAVLMARAYRDGEPEPLGAGEWHLPYVTAGERDELRAIRREANSDGRVYGGPVFDLENRLLKLSVARCARVSFRAFDGKLPDPEADIRLHDQLLADGHFSPFEHQARAHPRIYDDSLCRSGNFRGFEQYRQTLPESVRTAFDFAKLDEFGERGFIV